MQRLVREEKKSENEHSEKDKNNQFPFLYVIRKTDENGIYNQLIDHLKKLNVIGKSVVIKEDGIYFNHNLKEISFLLGKFNSNIFDYEKYFNSFEENFSFGLNEHHVFNLKLIVPTAGIKFETSGPLVQDKANDKINKIRANEPKSLPAKELTPNENPDLLKSVQDALTHHDGASIGEMHTEKEGKQLLIYLMSQHIPDLTHLYVEVGFSDTQKELYETFNKTGQMPQILLHCLIGEDVGMAMIKVKDKNLINAYQDNPYGYLGMVVMAQMQNIAVVPLDVRESADSSHSLAVNSQFFQDKRVLIMNINSYEIIRDDANKKKYFVYDGSAHNLTNEFYKVPGIPSLLGIPFLTDQVWKSQIPECDVYTHALLIHNITRVLLGKPVKVYEPPAQIPDTVAGCQQLIFLQELAKEVNSIEWDNKGHMLMKFIPLKSTPTQITKLRNALADIDQLSSSNAIYFKFTTILTILQAGFKDDSIKISKPLQDTINYFQEKFLQGMDLLDPSFRIKNYANELPPILGYNLEPLTKKTSAQLKK